MDESIFTVSVTFRAYFSQPSYILEVFSDTDEMFETLEVEKASFKVKTKEKEEKKLKRAYFLVFKKFS